jgi:hypothetical protein
MGSTAQALHPRAAVEAHLDEDNAVHAGRLGVLEQIFGCEGGGLYVLVLEVSGKLLVGGVRRPDGDVSVNEVHLPTMQW